MAFDLTKPSMTATSWANALADIRENFRAIVQGDAGVFTKNWIRADPAEFIFEKSGQTAKAAITGIGSASNEDLHYTTNARWNGASWNRDDTAKHAWGMYVSGQGDEFVIRRSAAAANPITWTPLFRINSTSLTLLTTALQGVQLENGVGIFCKNSTGTYEQVLVGRYTDNVTYLNFGANGYSIRNNGATAVMAISANGEHVIGSGTVVTNTRLRLLGISGQIGYSQDSNGSFEVDYSGIAAGRFQIREDANISLSMRRTPSFGSGVGVCFIGNATTLPSANPTAGGVLYVDAGALKYRGSGGTITTIANA